MGPGDRDAQRVGVCANICMRMLTLGKLILDTVDRDSSFPCVLLFQEVHYKQIHSTHLFVCQCCDLDPKCQNYCVCVWLGACVCVSLSPPPLSPEQGTSDATPHTSMCMRE